MATNGPSIIVHGFFTRMEKDHVTGLRTRAVDYVRFSPRHSPIMTTLEERVSTMDPANLRLGDDDENNSMKMNFMRSRWDQIKPAYDAWKEGKEAPLDGIPLAAWPAVNDEYIEELRKHGIKTVQAVEAITDGNLGRIQIPNMRSLRDEARLFLQNTDKASLASQLASQNEQIASMAEEMAAMRALLDGKTKPKGREAA